MPRRSVADTLATKAAVLGRSVEIASLHGLDGLSFGRIADEVGLSKSGLAGHFPSKTDWQLAVIAEAVAIFSAHVVEPGRRATAPGRPRLRRTCTMWLRYLELPVFPGGCFFAAASVEFDDRAGPVRDAVQAFYTDWQGYLRDLADSAARRGEIEGEPDQIAFELLATMMALNHALRLGTDPLAPRRARRVIGRLLT